MLSKKLFDRRQALLGTAASIAGLVAPKFGFAQQTVSNQAYTGKAQPGDETRTQRLQWWHDAKFGMFIHFGVYSSIMRHEWNMENEAPPIAEYMAHAKSFKPSRMGPRAWAKLAKRAGIR